ncbi:restriction endonuclease subunit S [Eubacterium coprostanoligenes]|uniref:restriction endonuclease subunit S n=1 Tax=Eubacterium coprostanoligenes TaxID=290054 RepID=UPI002A8303FC|nr:restriction endonuclease subunit S [Eubacterium coprostanoligenes]MDY4698797.1 restriction endonuclease subunit S [Eubacterium coprostanoligenes]
MPYEKVGKNEPVCIADEVPFDIPDSWEWVRLSTANDMYTGNSINENEKKQKYTGLSDGYFYIGTKDVGFDHTINYDNGVRIPYDNEKFRIAPQNSILLCVEGGSAGRKISFTNQDVCFGNKLCCFVSFGVDYKFLYYYLQSPLFQSAFKENTTGIIGGVSVNTLKSMFLPIPPLNEQLRIVKEITKLEPFIDGYRIAEENLAKLNQTFPECLKKSILQEAVQGKLVPQDPNDEPASVLLERIRAEKQRLIKEGKIKKDKHESVIFRRDNSHYEKRGSEKVCIDDEILFEVPSSWALIRLNDIGIYRKGPFGSSLTKSMFVPKGDDTVKVYEQKNAIQKDHTLGTYYITRQYYESKMKSFTVEPGDILVSCAGTIGETYVLPEQIELGIINQALMRMTIYAPIDLNYFLMYFDYVLKQTAKDSSKGSAIKNIPPFEIFKKLILPLPPIEEQKRIVLKVRELENLCNLLY